MWFNAAVVVVAFITTGVALFGLRLLSPVVLHVRERPHLYYAGSIVVTIIVIITSWLLTDPVMRVGLIGGSVVLLAVGYVDERKRLSPLPQLVAQLGIVGSIVMSGWTISYVTNPFTGGIWYLGGLGSVVALLWLLALLNALNWSDGVDGLAAGLGLVAFVTVAGISLLPGTRDALTLKLSLVGGAVMLAFIIWNWPPARFYLGTTGSWFLGLYIGLVAMIGHGKVATTAIILALPLLDAALVIIQRIRHHQAPWHGDQRHWHHRLRQRGWRPQNIVFISLGVSLLCALLALALQAPWTCRDFSTTPLTIAGTKWSVAVAETPAEQARGLSGCHRLPAGSGLLFPFSPPAIPYFWMKDMRLPIDIIWIAQGNVVGISAEVPAPPAGTPDNALPIFTPPQPIDFALEIAAGQAAKHGIAPGATVTIDK